MRRPPGGTFSRRDRQPHGAKQLVAQDFKSAIDTMQAFRGNEYH
jgi:hypothetical protein